MKKEIHCEHIVTLVGQHSYYLYDSDLMTKNYAHWAFLAAEDNPLATFVDCVREDGRVYPRPFAAEDSRSRASTPTLSVAKPRMAMSTSSRRSTWTARLPNPWRNIDRWSASRTCSNCAAAGDIVLAAARSMSLFPARPSCRHGGPDVLRNLENRAIGAGVVAPFRWAIVDNGGILSSLS